MSVAPTSTSSMIQPTTPIAVHSSNTGVIVGGVLGGIGGILIAVAAVFFYRQRRSRAPSVMYDGIGSPVPMKFYVRILALRVGLVCPHSAPLGPARRPPRIPWPIAGHSSSGIYIFADRSRKQLGHRADLAPGPQGISRLSHTTVRSLFEAITVV